MNLEKIDEGEVEGRFADDPDTVKLQGLEKDVTGIKEWATTPEGIAARENMIAQAGGEVDRLMESGSFNLIIDGGGMAIISAIGYLAAYATNNIPLLAGSLVVLGIGSVAMVSGFIMDGIKTSKDVKAAEKESERWRRELADDKIRKDLEKEQAAEEKERRLNAWRSGDGDWQV